MVIFLIFIKIYVSYVKLFQAKDPKLEEEKKKRSTRYCLDGGMMRIPLNGKISTLN